jgi:hypothetical protein
MAKTVEQITIPSSAPAITDTGYKGYLKWLQRELPGVYQKIGPQLSTVAKDAFSDYNQSAVTRLRQQAGRASLVRRYQLRGMGDDSPLTDVTSSFDPLSIGVSSDVTSALNAVPDTSDAANTGTGSSSTSSIISSLFNGAASVMMTNSQLNTANQINQLQLQRAQAGLPPLNLSTSAAGIPLISGASLGSSSLLLIGGAALLLMVMMGRKSAA